MNKQRRFKAIHYEQAVYGSFPFWHRGYAVLAASAGCRPEWLDALRLAAQRLGERPAGTLEKDSLFALALRRGPWMIVGVVPVGCDDRGRPGALAFHALFVSPWSYRRAGSSPFAFLSALRRDWSSSDQDRILPRGEIVPSRREHEIELTAAEDSRVEAIVAALKCGKKVKVVSPGPIDDLAKMVWDRLPGRLRRRASVATWAYENANRFDLVAVPRLPGLPDPSELIVELDPSACGDEASRGKALPTPPSRSARRERGPAVIALMVIASVLTIATMVWRGILLFGTSPTARFGEATSRETGTSAKDDPPPRQGPARPGKEDELPVAPDERRRLIEALVDMLERFCPIGETSNSAAGHRDEARGEPDQNPGQLMLRLARCLRYGGASLSKSELERIASRDDGGGPGSDSAMAVRWHALTRRFLDDRPLPADFLDGPTRWQLSTLAWSFHVDDDPSVEQALTRGLADEAVHALADVLSVDVPVPSTSLSVRYPALDDYRAFLGRLPRR